MDEQETLRKLKLGNKILVVWPVGIASICLGLVGSGLVSPLWGVLLGLIMVVLCWFAWIFWRVLSDRAAASRPGSAASRPESGVSRPESGVSRPGSGAGDRR